ncbi:hypothetical protein C2845_PM08G08480 [Panicum miliaceum]|uniref:Uncharacterized protein n=1 Tax=Panicum miliaceum TaxID=4540 RepID=A0A3L6R6K3_PANMI|nr:hypothetical protein C2845_PM08G08480 [Panicum miliaceum]
MKCRGDGEQKAPEYTSITMCGCCEWWYEGSPKRCLHHEDGVERTPPSLNRKIEKVFTQTLKIEGATMTPPGRKMMPKNITSAGTSIKPGRACA